VVSQSAGGPRTTLYQGYDVHPPTAGHYVPPNATDGLNCNLTSPACVATNGKTPGGAGDEAPPVAVKVAAPAGNPAPAQASATAGACWPKGCRGRLLGFAGATLLLAAAAAAALVLHADCK